MAHQRKSHKVTQASTKVQPSTKVNWIFSAPRQSSAKVKQIGNAFFSDSLLLRSDTFNYAVIGVKSCTSKHNEYDIYGYVQIKHGRWTSSDLIKHVKYPIKCYSSGDTIWGRVEKEYKPADIVAHIRSVCDIRVIEAGEIRKKGPKSTLKIDADDINEDESEYGSEVESEDESEMNNPFLQKESSPPAESIGIKRKQTKSSTSAVELEFETKLRKQRKSSNSPVELESENDDGALLEGFVVAEKNDRIASTSSFATSSKRNESAISSPNRRAVFKRNERAVSSPNRLAVFNKNIYAELPSFDTSATNPNSKESLLNSMEVMMNRVLNTHYEVFLVKLHNLVDGLSDKLIAAAVIPSDDAAAQSDTNIKNSEDEPNSEKKT